MRGCGRRSRGRGRAAVGAARDGGAEQQPEEEERQEPPRVCHRVTRFCPQCGGGVEPSFRFCPACGERLPAPPPPSDAAGPPPQQVPSPAAAAGAERSAAGPGLFPPAARTPPRPPCAAARRGSPSPRKARPGPAEPLPEGEELRDRGAGRWRLRRLLEQGGCGLLYEEALESTVTEDAFAKARRKAAEDQSKLLRRQCRAVQLTLQDAKDSKIYNEQNFFQRAAKKDRVEKWKKLHSLPLLGIPSCVGFGLHADKYRFLVFSDLGRSLQSILNDNLHLNEKAAFQIAVRLLDCLEYLHENEYVHGDITADNIYVNPADLTQVSLAGYYFAFRYCPEGKHVARREGSRTPHEGTIEFISQDSHKGAAPSRRSDLESLGYCLLKWLCGFLPWSKELDKVETVMEKKEMYRNDVTCLLQQCFSRQRSIPDALQSYLQQVMALEYEEKPNYEALQQLFKKPLQMLKASAYDPVDIRIVP